MRTAEVAPGENARSKIRQSLRTALTIVAALTVAVGAASGQYLLGEEIVLQFYRSQPLFALDPFMSAILPGSFLVVVSAVLFAAMARSQHSSPEVLTATASDKTPEISVDSDGSASEDASRKLIWIVALEFGAGLAGLGLAAYLVKSLLTGPYRPEFPLFLLAALAALGLAFLANDLRMGISLSSGLRRQAKTWVLAEMIYLLALAAIFVYVNARELTGYFYAAIGDEYSFFYTAKGLAQGGAANLFTQKGVYGYHPLADSAYQALVMNLFGVNQFGWKLSGVLVVALSLIPLYFLVRHLFGIWAAAVAASIAATSHYLFAYSHTGYNNLHALLPTLVAAWAGAVGINRGSSALLFLSGAAAGIGFYTYFTARLAILALVLAVLASRFKLSTLRLLFSATVGFGVAVLPIFLVSKMDVINAMVANSAAKGGSDGLALVDEVMRRTLQSALVFNYNTAPGRFLWGSLLDPVSATLAAVGVVFALFQLRDFRYRYLIVWLLVGLVITGGFNHGTNIAETRLMLLVPFLAAFGGAAVDGFVRIFTHRSSKRALQVALPAACLLLLFPSVLYANAERFWNIMPTKLQLRPESLALRVVQSTEVDHASLASVVVIAPAPDALARLIFDTHDLGADTPILIAGGDKDLAAKYVDSPAIALLEVSPADAKAILARLQQAAPGASYTEDWDPMHRGAIVVLRNPRPEQNTGPAEPKMPVGLRAVMRLGGQGKSSGRFITPRDVAVDEKRNLYVADTGNGRVQKFDAGGKLLMAFGEEPNLGGQLKSPISVAVDGAGQVAVLDAADMDIKRFAADGQYLGQTGSKLGLTRPRHMTFDSQGNLFVADAGRVIKLTADMQVAVTITSGYGGDAKLQFRDLADVAMDKEGNLYILDGATGIITKLDSQGRLVSQWNTPARGGSSPPRLAIGTDGSLIVLASEARRILKIGPAGQVVGDFSGKTIVGERLEIPAGLAVDNLGYVYVADAGMHQLVRFAFY